MDVILGVAGWAACNSGAATLLWEVAAVGIAGTSVGMTGTSVGMTGTSVGTVSSSPEDCFCSSEGPLPGSPSV